MKQLKTLDGLALMPLYDWPELHHLTDAVWDCVRQAAREEGLDLPVGLDHRPQQVSAWMTDNVVFSQLCGSPWYRSHRHHARYLATSNFELTDNPDGHYYSKIIVAQNSPLQSLDVLDRARFTYNDVHSQSGVRCLRPLMDIERYIESGLESGGHRFSMEAVGEGRADFAAIDAFSFLLAEKIMPSLTAGVRVIAETAPRPAPVLITSARLDEDTFGALRRSVLAGLSRLPADISGAYSFRGAIDLGEAPYGVFDLGG